MMKLNVKIDYYLMEPFPPDYMYVCCVWLLYQWIDSNSINNYEL